MVVIFYFFKIVVKYTPKAPFLSLLSIQFSAIKYIHIVYSCHYLPSPGLFAVVQNWNSLSFKQLLSIYPPPASDNPHSTSCLWIWLYQVLRRSGILQYLSFCNWLISLNIIPSGFIHVIACVRISFLRLNVILLLVYITCVYSFICRWTLGCFHLLAAVYNAALNVGLHPSFWDPTFSYFGYVHRWNCWIVW